LDHLLEDALRAEYGAFEKGIKRFQGVKKVLPSDEFDKVVESRHLPPPFF
jgi:hypothetical protein